MPRSSLRGTLRNELSSSVSSSPTPFSIFGPALANEWDLSLSTVTIATGISNVADLRGGKDLSQGTGANQLIWAGSGLTKYAQNTGTLFMFNGTMSVWSGGVGTLLLVIKIDTAESGKYLFGSGVGNHNFEVNPTAADLRSKWNTSGGVDTITNGTVTTNVSALAMTKASGVVPWVWVNGGAKYVGAKTNGLTTVTSLGFPTNTSSFVEKSSLYWAGVLNRAATLAEINSWGAWAASRFGLTWSTAT